MSDNPGISFTGEDEALNQEQILKRVDEGVNKGEDIVVDTMECNDTPRTNSIKRIRDPRAPEPDPDLDHPDYGDLSPEEMTEFGYESPVETRHDYVEVDVHAKADPLDPRVGEEEEEKDDPPVPPPSPVHRPSEVRFSAEVATDPAGPSPTREPPVRTIAVNARTENTYSKSKSKVTIK